MKKVGLFVGMVCVLWGKCFVGCADVPLSQALEKIIQSVQQASSVLCLATIEQYEDFFDVRAIRDKQNNSLLQLVLKRSTCTPALLSKIIALSEPLDICHHNIDGQTLVDAVLECSGNHEVLCALRKRVITLCMHTALSIPTESLLCQKDQGDIIHAMPADLGLSADAPCASAKKERTCRATYGTSDIVVPRAPLHREPQLSLVQRYRSSPQFKTRDSNA